MSSLLHDLRFSLRLFTKAPGFTAAAVAVLTLSIGVNTGVFSIVNELLFSPRAWDSMKENWGLSGKQAGQASAWAINVLLDELKRMKG